MIHGLGNAIGGLERGLVMRNGQLSSVVVIAVLIVAPSVGMHVANAMDGLPLGAEFNNTGGGVSGWVRVADDDTLEPQIFTIEVWVTPLGGGYGGSGDSWGAAIVNKGGEGQNGIWLQSYYLAWTPTNRTICASVTHQWNASGIVLNSTGVVEIGERAHVAMSFDGAWLRIFIDGQLDSELLAGSSDVAFSDDDVLIGAGNFASGYIRAFQGIIDDVRLWDHARDAAEISAQMSCSLDGTEPGLLAYYSFNAGDCRDDSGNGHDGVEDGSVQCALSNDECLPFVSDMEAGDLSDWTSEVQ